MKMWGGRFDQEMNDQAWAMNASIGFDRRMASQDVRVSLAWVHALEQAGVLSAEQSLIMTDGLQRVLQEIETGVFEYRESDEDIHTAVERRLGELVGPLAGNLQIGRSRNDQVTTDFRLWLLEYSPALDKLLKQLMGALVMRAENDMGLIMPGLTHLQPAQPVLLSHWWLSHFWPLARDRQRLDDWKVRLAWLPLGSGAMAGTSFGVDRQALAESLGFGRPGPNSIDSVSDRDFAAEFLFIAALIGVHLSRLAESIILFTNPAFGYFELSDAYSSGSSLMPQKKNPDPFELARGKTGVLMGALTSLLATLKGLPSAYDKDLQEDKPQVFMAYDQLLSTLPVMAGALETLEVFPERMASGIRAEMMATDLANYLVSIGIPFRQAHEQVGALVAEAHATGKPLEEVALDTLETIPDVVIEQVFSPEAAITRNNAVGGTSEDAVKKQLAQARQALEEE
ncbi:MAG: argininosuccinate lyase [Anaerolineales bacterium]|nr:argininosuccinate lyase [Anaerolineales bacterium]